MSEQFKMVLEELNEVLEGGDIALDFEDEPSASVILRIISNIVGDALRAIKTHQDLLKMLNAIDTNNHAINDHKESSE